MSTIKTNWTRKQAERMITPEEKKRGVSVYNSKAWLEHKEAIKRKVKKQQDAAHAKAILRKEQKGDKKLTKKEIKEAKKLVEKIEKKKIKNQKYQAKLAKRNGQNI